MKEIHMKKVIAVLVSFCVVVSLYCVSFAAEHQNRYGHSYSSHREQAFVEVETKPLGGSWFVAVELWNYYGRFPDYDDISSGVFYTLSAYKHSADTGTYNGAVRGYYSAYAKDAEDHMINNTYGHGFDE